MKFTKYAIVALTAFAVISTASASASTLSDFIEANAAGQGIEMKIVNFDMGTVYGNDTVGTTSNTPDTWAAGQAGPTGGVGAEDGWGIFVVSEIALSTNTANPFYQRGNAAKGGNTELVGIFYGLQDTYVEQSGATSHIIASVNVTFDIYEQATGAFDETAGSAARGGASVYTTVTGGTKVLTAMSAAGFLRIAGDKGGVATEFESEFNNAGNSGSGDTYLNIVAGSGDLADILNTNQQSTAASAINGVANSDIKIDFTTKQYVGQGDWLVQSNDPVSAHVVPLPGAASMGFGLMGLVGLARKRRSA